MIDLWSFQEGRAAFMVGNTSCKFSPIDVSGHIKELMIGLPEPPIRTTHADVSNFVSQ
jgi:hypothetical protein